MVCDVCGKKGARVRRVIRTFGKGKNTLLIEAVPIVRCPNCGERYLTADTLREIQRLRVQRRRASARRLMAVLRFGGAA